ncbi:MAG: helix-turn-helix transcriptional regulator [Ignavibacteriales bacterium]|nr:helix-turn-helix transcriptional regulator [Ignavibacteriales bacterium]
MIQYRKSHGITQKELARQIGVDPTTLSRLERKIGKYLPPTAEKMSKFLAESTCIHVSMRGAS